MPTTARCARAGRCRSASSSPPARQERSYPYPIARKLRNEVFTRRGGLYFGSAILLDYEVPYDQIVYSFADFSAGRYSSRNAAFRSPGQDCRQAAGPDGDLLRYENGLPANVASSVEDAALNIAYQLEMSRPQIRRDLLLEKTPAFSRGPYTPAIFARPTRPCRSHAPPGRRDRPEESRRSPAS